MQGFFFNIRSGGVKQFSELFQPEPRNKRARIKLEIGKEKALHGFFFVP